MSRDLFRGEKKDRWQKLYSMYTGICPKSESNFAKQLLRACVCFLSFSSSLFLHALELIHTLFCIATANLLQKKVEITAELTYFLMRGLNDDFKQRQKLHNRKKSERKRIADACIKLP